MTFFIRRRGQFFPERAAFEVVASDGTCARYATALRHCKY